MCRIMSCPHFTLAASLMAFNRFLLFFIGNEPPRDSHPLRLAEILTIRLCRVFEFLPLMLILFSVISSQLNRSISSGRMPAKIPKEIYRVLIDQLLEA